MATSPDDLDPTDDLDPEYDFRSLRGVTRGKYAARYHEKMRIVRLGGSRRSVYGRDCR